jgi:hypothetical protein
MEIHYAIDLYRQEHPEVAGEPLAPEELAAWIEDREILAPVEVDPVEIRTKQIVRYLSRETQTDPQGREVRANAVNFVKVNTKDGPKRRSRWLPLFESPEEFAKEFFQWCRSGAAADIVSYENTRESYNENNTQGGFVERQSLDFTDDVEDKRQPATYPTSAPDDEEEDR